MNRRWILVAAGVLLGLYLLGLVPRLLLRSRLNADADAERTRLPTVSTMHPRRADEVVTLPLPGSMEPILVTGIYARTDGYLRARHVDIGDRVEAHQLLAEIETPEVDQQLRQAHATLVQDRATVAKLEAELALARSTLARYRAAGTGTVSKQQIDERASAVTDAERSVDAQRATVAADEAAMQRFEDLQSFQKVYAPFAGVITVRNVDPGSLVSAGSSSAVTELFELAKVDRLRIFVWVPQAYSLDVAVGQHAEVTVRERPGEVFEGVVTRTAGAIDPTSRTMRTEVQVPNPDGRLLSGAYATVRFALHRPNPPLLVPASALRIDADGIRVGVITPDGTLMFKAITLGRDYGTDVEVLSGVDTKDVLAVSVPPGITDGTKVAIAETTAEQGGATSPGPTSPSPAPNETTPSTQPAAPPAEDAHP